MTMRRVVSFAIVGFGVAVLAGCPIYGNDRDFQVCDDSGCYDCPNPYYSSSCFAWTCNSNYDCPNGFTCESDHRCRPNSPPPVQTCTKPSDCPDGNCGADNRCHSDDCSVTGCPSSYVCKLSGGVAACVPVTTPTDGGVTSTCKKDSDCPTPAGSKCLSGTCVAPADQCADQTQCPSGSQCVDGACTPSCNAEVPCPTGYTCDLAKGVCTGTTGACTDSSQCTGGTVCVQEHCVNPCSTEGTCPAGLVCIDGGCTPNEKPTFSCTTDGVQSDCQNGSICLRRSCYIACDADAGPDACKNADTFNVCKAVTTSSGEHSVCGSATNLGSECDPTQGKNCAAPLICIDGFCR